MEEMQRQDVCNVTGVGIFQEVLAPQEASYQYFAIPVLLTTVFRKGAVVTSLISDSSVLFMYHFCKSALITKCQKR